jgi:hypothetical protein
MTPPATTSTTAILGTLTRVDIGFVASNSSRKTCGSDYGLGAEVGEVRS